MLTSYPVVDINNNVGQRETNNSARGREMIIATEMNSIVVHANKFDAAILEIISESEKAIQVRNRDCGRKCWLPKSALVGYKPGVPTYENEYIVANWFWSKMNLMQQKVLNIAE